MLTFVRNEKGKPEAQEGQHDDCVLADAICQEIREQQSMFIGVVATSSLPKDMPEDLVEDYWGAPESERPRLLAKWGYANVHP
jgi:phage terminase large subunit